MRCASCDQDLLGKPKINVEGSTYCYRCSKKEVEIRHTASREFAAWQYAREKHAYDEASAKFFETHHRWRRNRDDFVNARTPGYAMGIVGAVVFYFIAEEIGKGLGIVGVIAAFILWRIISSRLSRKWDAKFRSLNPEPTFDCSYPQRPEISPVSHTPYEHDGSVLKTANYREAILRRDDLTCQICGQKKRRKNLEVHHIIPSSKGGTDESTNLVTVCKHCHDREDWYEHVRAYPTTIKKSKPRNRMRSYRYKLY